jgi:glycine/D-amino acid oxidase-like deaminating enzyme
MPASPRILIIGAGLQGLSIALALAARGLPSTLLERRDAPMTGASLGNEGKIHLGLVYALDPSLDTGRLMLEGALSFSPLLDRWLGPQPWAAMRSAGFRYAVMPGSLASLDSLAEYYARLQREVPAVKAALPVQACYVGRPLERFVRSASDTLGSPVVDGSPVPCLETDEVAVDTSLLASVLTRAVRGNPSIRLRTGVHVLAARKNRDGYALHVEANGGQEEIAADIVVNCAWTDRVRIDSTLRPDSEEPSRCYRVKHRVIVEPSAPLAAFKPVTMVQGPFGDIVPLADGAIYLSWYPECRTYFDRSPPAEEIRSEEVLRAVGSRTLERMTELFPALSGARIRSCSPCVIVAAGTSDVDRPESELHRRTHAGPLGGDGWWSVETGKLTLAPLNAERTVRRVLDELGERSR